ncbi:MAG TPA: Na+/H+ antiporter NhaA [Vicinamibacterales bacterium]|nr:Na+/H+ antiporter NhaA [Vicinamibacterales bacterium]
MPARLDGAGRVLKFILDNSLLLLAGAIAGLVWANLDLDRYTRFTHALHFFVNDIAMVFFFALVTKEVYEATLPGGPLSERRQAAMPVLAAIGGMAVPASIYALFVLWLGRADELMRGWAIPCATDIAFSYLVARVIFRTGHPAIPFLLLLAIADDVLGLIVLALFYPQGSVNLGLVAAGLGPALFGAWLLRRTGTKSFWLYVLGPGLVSWIGLYLGGIHPALALVPIVPLMPHGRFDLKRFGARPAIRLATMEQFEEWWRIPVQVILMMFGLVNAGVPVASVGPVTAAVTLSLLIGKPIGVAGATAIGELFGLRRSSGLNYRALVVLGVTAGIGFTVALFFTTASFPPGPVLDEAKMGALLSFLAAPLAIGLGRVLKIRKVSI